LEGLREPKDSPGFHLQEEAEWKALAHRRRREDRRREDRRREDRLRVANIKWKIYLKSYWMT
jgi:hypothetical protein